MTDASPVSLERLTRDVAVIAAEPHPTGSDANARVRAYLLTELEAVTLSPQVQAGEMIGRYGKQYALQNVVCRIPADAPDGRPGLLVACHYDSVPVALGAGDDGAGVAALLETARLLRETPGRRRDLVLLFSDGEEAGLLGARLWVRQNPDRLGCADVLNFDARGTRGPPILFETAGNFAPLFAAYVGSAPHPVTSSVATAVYERMPNGTDFSVFARAGMGGLNFAFIDGFANYHTPRDDPRHLSPATLWTQAAQVLAVTREAATQQDSRTDDLRPSVYFDVAGRFVVRYGLVAVALTALGILLGAVAAARLRPRPRWVAAALVRHVIHLLIVVAWVWLISLSPTDKLTHERTWLAFAGAAALSTAGLPWLAGGRGGKRRRDALIVALLFIMAVGGAVTTFTFPAGSYLFAVPLLTLSTAALLPRPLLAVAAAVSTLILLPLAWLAALALTVRLLAVPAVLLTLLVWLWTPSVVVLGRRRLRFSTACAGIAAICYACVYFA